MNFFIESSFVFIAGTCTLILGKHLGFLKPEESSQLTSKLAEAVRVHFTAARDAFYGLPLWKLLPTATYKRLIESEDTIYKSADIFFYQLFLSNSTKPITKFPASNCLL